MYVSNIKLFNFRNYDTKEIELQPGLNAIVGQNGIGKTNILEAISACFIFSSFRTKYLTELIKKNASWSRIELTINKDDDLFKRVLKLDNSNNCLIKKLEINTTSKPIVRNLLPIVSFDPEELSVLRHGADARREFLDELIESLDPSYELHLKKYKRALLQRNRLLKTIARGHASMSDLFIWNVSLSELAAPIIKKRAEVLASFSGKVGQFYNRLGGNDQELLINYLPNFISENIAHDLFLKLEEAQEKEVLIGFTRHGPHRDDFEVVLNDKKSRISASRGEIRSILLSMKLVQVEEMHRTHNIRPIVLLDDVLSELDKFRVKRLITELKDSQMIISSTSAVKLNGFNFNKIILK